MSVYLDIKALAFDVIGTVVDYRTTILREGSELSQAKGLDVDWPAFVAAWRSEERLGEQRVERGEWPWTSRDEIHRRSLNHLLPGKLAEAERPGRLVVRSGKGELVRLRRPIGMLGHLRPNKQDAGRCRQAGRAMARGLGRRPWGGLARCLIWLLRMART